MMTRRLNRAGVRFRLVALCCGLYAVVLGILVSTGLHRTARTPVEGPALQEPAPSASSLPASNSPAAEGERCSETEERAGEIKDWRELHQILEKSPGCDDGAIAEAYSEFVVHMLATRWGTLGQLQVMARADPRFVTFVLKHIDTTADRTELQTVRRNAIRRCPRGERKLRHAIAAAATAALDETAALDAQQAWKTSLERAQDNGHGIGLADRASREPQ